MYSQYLKKTMDKNTFKQEINDYTARGGKFAFAFGDIRLPVHLSRGVEHVGRENASTRGVCAYRLLARFRR